MLGGVLGADGGGALLGWAGRRLALLRADEISVSSPGRAAATWDMHAGQLQFWRHDGGLYLRLAQVMCQVSLQLMQLRGGVPFLVL